MMDSWAMGWARASVSSADSPNGPAGKQHDADYPGGKLGARAATCDDLDGTLALLLPV
jgi:hypothetical protein